MLWPLTLLFKFSEMYVRKRKRAGPFGGGGTVALYTAPKASGGPQTKRRKTGAGYTRTSGYYGRFASGGGELKFYDQELTQAIISSNGSLINGGSVVNIAQGTGEKNRIGRNCTLESMHLRYTLKVPFRDAQGTPSNGDSVRFIVYQDKQCNGETVGVTDILENSDIHSFRNLANTQRFNILMDKISALNYGSLASDGAGVVSSNAESREFISNKKCHMKLEFNNTTGAIAELRSNNIGVLMISAYGAASCGGTVRFRFRG